MIQLPRYEPKLSVVIKITKQKKEENYRLSNNRPAVSGSSVLLACRTKQTGIRLCKSSLNVGQYFQEHRQSEYILKETSNAKSELVLLEWTPH